MSGLLRACGLILLAGCGAGLGLWKLRLLEQRYLLYRELARFLALVRESIESRGLPLDELLAQARQRYPFRLFPPPQASDLRRLSLPDWCPLDRAGAVPLLF